MGSWGSRVARDDGLLPCVRSKRGASDGELAERDGRVSKEASGRRAAETRHAQADDIRGNGTAAGGGRARGARRIGFRFSE